MDYKNTRFKIANECDRGLCQHSCGRQDKQLNTYDWLADIPGDNLTTDLVGVQLKDIRKGYFHNVNGLDLKKGDIVAVEANPGHDIGVVTLIGSLVKLQIKKTNSGSQNEIKYIYRIAREADIEKYRETKAREHDTMIQGRKIAKDLGLQMKIGDVKYQDDDNKTIFYYIADERVDFRQLIKVLAETFHVRVETKQIGARQETGRIGGIGPCGREFCCATWMKNFVSASTNSARIQDISLSPQKLAGMCAKLRCCLNYEVDDYLEASRELPNREVVLHMADKDYYHFKADILTGMVTYSTEKNAAVDLETIDIQRIQEIIEMNKRGEKPASLLSDEQKREEHEPKGLLAGTDISRFDKNKNREKRPNTEASDGSAGWANNNNRRRNDQNRGPRTARKSDQERQADNWQGMRKLRVALILCVLFAACNEKKVYDTFRHTPLAGWEKNDSLAFDVPKLKASGRYQSALALRISNEYPFVGLTPIVEQTVHPTHTKYVDTFNCTLIRANGVPKGQGINCYQYAFDIISTDLHEGDSLYISVRHSIKRETLPGISNVGVSPMKR